MDGDTLKIKEPDDGKSIKQLNMNSTEDTFTVDEAVEYFGFGKFQVILSFLTGLAWVFFYYIFLVFMLQMADAMEMMILSILSPALLCEWNISTIEQAMITTCVFSGMMLSSTFWGKFCDKFGRRTVKFIA